MTVFGVDDRITIHDSWITSTPYRATVLIESHYSNGTVTTGTGVMIGPDDVLTAAHCVYDQTLGWADTYVSPAHTPSGATFGIVGDTNILTTEGWGIYNSFEYDYAYIKLSENIGYRTGWLEIGTIGSVGDTVESIGYPGDHGGNQMVYTNGTIDAIDGNVFKFSDDLDATPGQSGSPVTYIDDMGNLAVVGIVSHENYWPVNINGVLRLNDTMITQINEWADMPDTVRFDGDYYLANNPDVANAGVNPFSHYFDYGWLEGRNPCSSFDTSFYLTMNPDVADAGVNPLQHYMLTGKIEGRQANFNDSYYLNTNPDVAESYLGSAEEHYINYGQFEGRSPNEFIDETPYLLTTIAPVQLSGIQTDSDTIIQI